MQEFNDSVQRAERLSVARENFLMGKNNRPDLVTLEDLAIYTRWLVCHLQALGTIHHYLQVVGTLTCQYTAPGEGKAEAQCPHMGKHSPANALSIWLLQKKNSHVLLCIHSVLSPVGFLAFRVFHLDTLFYLVECDEEALAFAKM